jgi:hypothetical protein
MSWYVHALMASELARDRERAVAIRSLQRAAKARTGVRAEVPRFGRVRRPLARLAMAIGRQASRAATALDPQVGPGSRAARQKPQTTHG